MDSTEPWEELDPDDWKGSTEGNWESEGEEWKSTEMQNNYGAPWHVYPEYWLYLRSTG